jgi:hypothetical protein
MCLRYLKQKCPFFKNGEQEGKTVPVYLPPNRGWYQFKRGGYKERVQEGECSRNIMYSYVKIER